MRHAMILMLTTLPMLAQPRPGRPAVPVTARIETASVLFGPGIVKDRSGETPPAQPFETRLSGQVKVEGLREGAVPRLRFWLASQGQEARLRKASPRSAGAKALVSSEPGKPGDGGLRFSIPWPKATVEERDLLFVEVFMGRKRVATAISPIQSHYLPASHPRDREEKN